VEATSVVLNVTFGSAGTKDTCYKLVQKSIRQSVRCVEENSLCKSGLIKNNRSVMPVF
jgi:hypothetical protein